MAIKAFTQNVNFNFYFSFGFYFYPEFICRENIIKLPTGENLSLKN